jgi:hypothetical protein
MDFHPIYKMKLYTKGQEFKIFDFLIRVFLGYKCNVGLLLAYDTAITMFWWLTYLSFDVFIVVKMLIVVFWAVMM